MSGLFCTLYTRFAFFIFGTLEISMRGGWRALARSPIPTLLRQLVPQADVVPPLHPARVLPTCRKARWAVHAVRAVKAGRESRGAAAGADGEGQIGLAQQPVGTSCGGPPSPPGVSGSAGNAAPAPPRRCHACGMAGSGGRHGCPTSAAPGASRPPGTRRPSCGRCGASSALIRSGATSPSGRDQWLRAT